MPQIKLIITDLDNTLYNWVDYYIPSFLAMVDEISKISKIDQEVLKRSFKILHEQFKTTEYTFAIQQLPEIRAIDPEFTTAQILEKYSPALKAFRLKRKESLRLYPGVYDTLVEFKQQKKMLAAVTDSLRFHAEARLKQLSVDGLFDAFVSPPDHGFPSGTAPGDVRFYEDETKYRVSIPVRIQLGSDVRKPDASVLMPLLERLSVCPHEAIYIGDSLTRDILMAQRCVVYDVLAEYGSVYMQQNYEELLKITYWTQREIDEDARLRTCVSQPSFKVSSFSQIERVIEGLERLEE